MRCVRSSLLRLILVVAALAAAGCSDDDPGPKDAGLSDAASDAGRRCSMEDCSALDGPCEIGVCDPTTDRCVLVPRDDGTACDDGDPCTDGDQCTAGACAGESLNCAALADGCNTAMCDPAMGRCVVAPLADGRPCDDGDPCTQRDRCVAGACTGEAPDCSGASDMCNVGMCDPATGACVPTPVADATVCDDGDRCTTADACLDGACVGEALDCSGASDMCNVGVCSPATGACDVVPVPDGTYCAFDADSCTIDECTAGGCGATRAWCFFDAIGRQDTAVRGSPGGTDFADDCPPGEVVVGVIASTVGWFSGVRAVCGRVTLRGDNPFSLALTTTGETPLRGASGSAEMAGMCPADHVVVGFGGRSGAYIDQLVLRCAPLTATLDDTGVSLSPGPAVGIGPIGGMGGFPFADADCPTGTVAAGIRGREEGYIRAFGLGCGTPSLAGGVTRLLDECDRASTVLDRHAGTACRDAPAGVSFVDLADDVRALVLYREPGCAGPSLRLTSDAALCGLTYEGTDDAVDGNVGSFRLEY